jgi:alpha-tubulin suppressor-like RCC1 family protein
MIVLSVMPLLGMEMLRVEATPLEVLVIDKIHGQYGKATYAEINRKLSPAVNWDVLQQIASAELPTGNERARMVYNFGKQVIEVVIDYPARKTDVPVRVSAQRIDRYTQVDISKWL